MVRRTPVLLSFFCNLKLTGYTAIFQATDTPDLMATRYSLLERKLHLSDFELLKTKGYSQFPEIQVIFY